MFFKSIVNRLNLLSLIFLALLPLSFIAGRFFADLSITLIAIIFLLNINNHFLKKYFLNIYFVTFCLISIYFIILSLSSDNITYSLNSSLFYIRFIIFSLAVWFLLDTYPHYIKYLTYILIFTFCFVLIDGYIQFFSGKNLLGYEYNGIRMSGIFGKEYILGSFLSRLLPIVFALTLLTFQNNNKIVYPLSVLLIATDVLIYISGERLAFFYVTLITLLFICLISRWKKIRISTFIISLGIILLISFTSKDLKQRMIDDTIKQTNILGEDKVAFTSEHEALYSSALSIYKDNYIFGIGPKMFRLFCDYPQYKTRFGCSTHPHNTYIQLLVETGILGFAFFLLIFLYISYNFILQLYYLFILKKSYLSDYQIFLLIGVFITLWPFSPTSNFFGSTISIIYYYPIGFLLKSFYKE